ncbi:acyltransferase [Kitasatospora atroaurantiaca]|uniref:Peptidoglycan/LPS O-acetylase OafA/YrhL n=1 Tax=Kitasatospora atroaurantiaca TaxID=285545 RepID=A0A561EQE6_9ACTN|nr:acyltransferase [Kitasatospora atroaurantiaca]TWE17843.1 peptidoglycan/LPS O-acetylase OafA/YrhL [Kitasatospora atroaurantiaca]
MGKKPAGSGSLAGAWSQRNGFGALRLLLALAVIASHSFPLGFGRPNMGAAATRGQTDVGTLAVCGFFVLSGLLITRSGRRLGVGRFLWHRALRILPGLWCCLLVTALVVAPLVAWHEGRDLSAWWSRPDGPWSYLAANWTVTVHQYGIGGLLAGNPHPGAFNGSIWSLSYEVLAYLGVALLAALGVLRRARWVVLLLAMSGVALLTQQAVRYDGLRAPTYAAHGELFTLPVFGTGNTAQLVPLFFMFSLGALAELFRERFPINRFAAGVAAGVLLLSLRLGGFTLVGLPAVAYLLIWSAVRMPTLLCRIGAKNDYSYGLYIYAFVAQQVLTDLGVSRWGYLPYFVLSTLCAMGAAVLSWYLVEAPALRLKNVLTPRRGEPVREPQPEEERRRSPRMRCTSSSPAGGQCSSAVLSCRAGGRGEAEGLVRSRPE